MIVIKVKITMIMIKVIVIATVRVKIIATVMIRVITRVKIMYINVLMRLVSIRGGSLNSF
jgi:hypothetical protein